MEWCGDSVPLPQWFVKGKDPKLTNVSKLDNFHSYLQNLQNFCNTFLEEMQSRQHYKAKGRTPYFSKFLIFALLLRYSSAQAYQILLEHLPFPSMPLLQKLRKGKVDAIKAAKSLKEKNVISEDVILMADKIHLRKSAYYSGGECIGVDSSGNAYKGIMVFMICGLKASIPIVVKACPEISLNGEWVATHMDDWITFPSESDFKVRAIVTGNHSSNVNTFKALKKMFHDQASHSSLFVQHPENPTKTCLFFDNVHLLKNI